MWYKKLRIYGTSYIVRTCCTYTCRMKATFLSTKLQLSQRTETGLLACWQVVCTQFSKSPGIKFLAIRAACHARSSNPRTAGDTGDATQCWCSNFLPGPLTLHRGLNAPTTTLDATSNAWSRSERATISKLSTGCFEGYIFHEIISFL